MDSTVTNPLTNVTGSSSSTSTTGLSNTKNLGKDEFMKLLLAQLKNQDPLKPMDGTDFAVQLAQFSSLEQLSNLNTELKNQGVNQMTLGYAQSVNMIGKEVVAQNGNTIQVDGASTAINYNLGTDAASVAVRVFDGEGNLVRTLEESDRKAGMNSLIWDSSEAAQGQYTFQVTATDLGGQSVSAQTRSSGVVTAAHFKNNAITLTVNGQEVSLSDIVSVKEPAAAS